MLPARTRVSFVDHPQLAPQYLRGMAATVICKQPGEDRYLVRVDNHPDARRYAGGVWCVHESTIVEMEDPIDEKGKRAADQWLAVIAPKIEAEFQAWAAEQADATQEELELQHAYLMSRFYRHLASLLADAADGWETLFQSSIQDEGDQRG
jgi:hypothetical protein